MPRVSRAMRARPVLAAVAGAVVLAGAGVAGGLLWPSDSPQTEAGAADAFSRAPDCGVIDGEMLSAALPQAAVEADERGPLPGGHRATCAWSSVSAAATDPEQTDPQFLRVDFEVHYTQDGTAQGTELAAQRLDTPVPDAPFPEGAELLGRDARAQPVPAGTAGEVTFRRDNLAVWVRFGGVQDDAGTEIASSEAHEMARVVAEGIAAEL